jgi:tetratricopeptide (TPR) repeat protein
MPITVTCPNCGKRGRIPGGFRGEATCPACRSRFVVKVTTAPAAPPDPVRPDPQPPEPQPATPRPARRSWPRRRYVLLGLVAVPVLWFAWLLFQPIQPNYIGNGYKARERGDYAEAERQYKLALATETKEGAINIARDGLALTYQKMGRHKEALPLLKECVDYQKRQFLAEGPKGHSSLNYGLAVESLALSEVALGRWPDAFVDLEISLRLKEGPRGLFLGVPDYLARAEICRHRGLYKEADGYIERGMAGLIGSIGSDNIAFAMCLEARAALYREWQPGDWQPAVWETSAKAIRSRVAAEDRGGGTTDRTGQVAAAFHPDPAYVPKINDFAALYRPSKPGGLVPYVIHAEVYDRIHDLLRNGQDDLIPRADQSEIRWVPPGTEIKVVNILDQDEIDISTKYRPQALSLRPWAKIVLLYPGTKEEELNREKIGFTLIEYVNRPLPSRN